MNGFTALDMNTRIAVSGYPFSDMGGTLTTWSDLCSTHENRVAFIQSAAEFVDKNGSNVIE
jgi:chitinase